MTPQQPHVRSSRTRSQPQPMNRAERPRPPVPESYNVFPRPYSHMHESLPSASSPYPYVYVDRIYFDQNGPPASKYSRSTTSAPSAHLQFFTPTQPQLQSQSLSQSQSQLQLQSQSQSQLPSQLQTHSETQSQSQSQSQLQLQLHSQSHSQTHSQSHTQPQSAVVHEGSWTPSGDQWNQYPSHSQCSCCVEGSVAPEGADPAVLHGMYAIPSIALPEPIPYQQTASSVTVAIATGVVDSEVDRLEGFDCRKPFSEYNESESDYPLDESPVESERSTPSESGHTGMRYNKRGQLIGIKRKNAVCDDISTLASEEEIKIALGVGPGDATTQKKTKHRISDRQRRAKIRECITTLRDAMASGGVCSNRDQISVLIAAAAMISNLRKELTELRHLKSENGRNF